jgi:hypothetical protein
MTDDLFNSQALKVLAGEASPEEKLALDQTLASDPALARDFAALEKNFFLLKTSIPLSQALESTEPVLPAYRMQELRSAVRKTFPATLPEKPVFRWPQDWIPRFSYAGCALVLILMAGALLNHRSGIEFGTYEDSLLRDGNVPEKMESVSVQSFTTDQGFQQWQESRFGPQYRIWFDEAGDRIMVVQPGGLFSKSRTSSYSLPEGTAERKTALKKIIAGLSGEKTQPKN